MTTRAWEGVAPSRRLALECDQLAACELLLIAGGEVGSVVASLSSIAARLKDIARDVDATERMKAPGHE